MLLFQVNSFLFVLSDVDVQTKYTGNIFLNRLIIDNKSNATEETAIKVQKK